jgi:hypothetical protein
MRPRRACRALLEQLLQDSSRPCNACSLAWVYAALGEPAEAIRWLEIGYQRRDPWMIWVNVDPRLDSLHGERDFQALVKRLHLMPAP